MWTEMWNSKKMLNNVEIIWKICGNNLEKMWKKCERVGPGPGPKFAWVRKPGQGRAWDPARAWALGRARAGPGPWPGLANLGPGPGPGPTRSHFFYMCSTFFLDYFYIFPHVL